MTNIIFVGDMHLSERRPISRTDDWIKAQYDKIMFIKKMAKKHDAIVVTVGDVFDNVRNSNFFLAWCITMLPYMYVVPGNHDLPGNTMKNFERSPLAVLKHAEIISILTEPTFFQSNSFALYPFPYGESLENLKLRLEKVSIAVMHFPLYKYKVPFWHKGIAKNHKEIRKELNNYDLIVSGDVHEPFLDTRRKPYVLNCGSMMRRTSVQINYEPGIWLVEEDLKITRIPFPIDKKAVTKEHRIDEQKKDEHLMAFLKRFDDTFNISLDFEETIQRFFSANNTPKDIRDIVYAIMDQEELI